MTLAIDFDGVIHQYSRGWQDGTIYDPPMPGALDGLRALMAHDAVFIFTTREPEQVMPWLEQHGFDVTIDERCGRCLGSDSATCTACEGSGLLTFWNLREQLLVTNRKLAATAYLDDRAVRFTSWDQALTDLGPAVVSPAAPQPEPTGDLDITPYLTVHLYRRDDGQWLWSWRCDGHGKCTGWLALDFDNRPHAERNARGHLTENHPDAAPAEPTP